MDQHPTQLIDLEAENAVPTAVPAPDRRGRSHLLGVAVTAAVLVLLGGVMALRSDTPTSPGSDLSGVSLPAPVVPTATDTDGFRLWFMTADGKRQVPVTDFYPEASALGAAWSPDGTRVAFHHSKGIMVINAARDRPAAPPRPGR